LSRCTTPTPARSSKAGSASASSSAFAGHVADNPDGVVVDYSVERGNPPDAGLLAPAIARVAEAAGRPPPAVAADRGCGEAAADKALAGLGVADTAIPGKGKPGKARRDRERSRPLRRLVKWRTGSEGRIACLKRQYGWDRSRLDGAPGARVWCGMGVFAHNLVTITRLIAAKDAARRRAAARRARHASAAGASGRASQPPARPPP
jgi:transposase, IS5 family